MVEVSRGGENRNGFYFMFWDLGLLNGIMWGERGQRNCVSVE